MLNDTLPDWERVLASAAHLQRILPDAVLVGGSASALYAEHRLSTDADHVLTDLKLNGIPGSQGRAKGGLPQSPLARWRKMPRECILIIDDSARVAEFLTDVLAVPRAWSSRPSAWACAIISPNPLRWTSCWRRWVEPWKSAGCALTSG